MTLRPSNPREAAKKQREWRQRSARRYEDSLRDDPKVRKVRDLGSNRERKAKKYERNFGYHADTIRRLPCCACRPELYREDRPLPEPGPERVSDPSHTVPRGMGGAGGDKTTLVPHCRSHHREFEAWGKRRNERHRETHGVHTGRLADRLWREAV